MAARLPDELIVEILSFLPAKSLLRWRSVSKYWLNLINSTKFKRMHLHNFNQLNPRCFVRRFDWYNVHFDDEAFTLDRGTKIEFPSNISRIKVCSRIVGCCNGVVCLYDDKRYRSGSDMVILWNPSIRRRLTLELHLIGFENSFVVLGFGYDKLSDDYKLVYLAYNDYGFTGPPHVEVYALKTGIWREVMFPHNLVCYFTYPNRLQVFFNGTVHWIASDRPYGGSHNSIMTFDITTELFGEILLPDDDLVKVGRSTMMISVVGESLAVTYYDNLINEGSTYKTWVMKEYKNPTSWTLIHNMHHPDIDMGKPLKLRNNGDMITKSRDGNVMVYNYSGYASCIFPRYESQENCMSYVDIYQESLALLDVGDSDPNKEGMKALMMRFNVY